MALKFISFAELLGIGGDGGVSGDTGCKTPVHAGFTVPTGIQQAFPPVLDSGNCGNTIHSGGDTKTQQPCGLQKDVPTDPTVPTEFEQPAHESDIDPANWRELATAYHAHHFDCLVCIAAGRGSRFGLRCGVGAALWYAYNQ